MRVTVKEASEQLKNLPEQAIRILLQQEKLPIGYAVKTKKGNHKYTYYIFQNLLDDFKKEKRG
ncbi:hypothetical protein D3C80_2082160 [compost metagenome]